MFTAAVWAVSRLAPLSISQRNMPNVASIIRTEMNATRQMKKRDAIGASAGIGGRAIVSLSGGSNASATPSVTAVTRLTHRICTGVIGKR